MIKQYKRIIRRLDPEIFDSRVLIGVESYTNGKHSGWCNDLQYYVNQGWLSCKEWCNV